MDPAGDGLLLVLGSLLVVTGFLALRRRSARDVAATILVGAAGAAATLLRAPRPPHRLPGR
ncbi:hypothetical protein [Actinomadura sp. NEAU-AAG7]|uniref:hypothetical protein n=1 Tax=Actinomadura sp. NEAU-AAG7 TaxID=2839640 RepID=UPI001BE4528D|nr:hypothetical protein [Actinomadura sp. NEAU-AAG7]MBT2209295.1 hypothetical protein [Actinomadura sp. NEAU-AAG7]